MAPAGHAGKPAQSSHSEARGSAAGPLFALLLNGETRDEGEELLDYSFPAEDQELQHVAKLKGVFIASCGVMRAAVGQDVLFFSFWSEDGSRNYKASLRRIEKWIQCIVLPGDVPDSTAEFYTQEAAGLVALRHGRLSSLQGHFRQLDPIFRALASMWRCSAHFTEDGGVAAGTLYTSLRVVLWNSLAESWEAEVGQRVAEWEERWQSTVQDRSLAQPEGFALFLCQTLVGTSLANRSFEACLRLCLLEGALEPPEARAGARPGAKACDSCDVRCHSLFLQEDRAGSAALPSHQYSVLHHGPWLLFMLWRMASAGMGTGGGGGGGSTPGAGLMEGASPRTPAKALLQGSDPFGVDLCLELLGGLPLPSGWPPPSSERPRHSPRADGGTSREGWRPFTLPCPAVFRPTSKSGKTPRRRSEPTCRHADLRFLCALELPDAPGPEVELARPPCFQTMQRPRVAASDRLPEAGRLRCPEMALRAERRRHCEPAGWGARELLREWSELEWLLQSHRARRAAWRDAPGPALTRHALVAALKGPSELDKLWSECLEESSLVPAERRSPAATRLGDGDPWRFQVGAPFLLSDIAPLVSAGTLTGAGARGTWAAVSALVPASQGPCRSPRPGHLLLQLDAMEGPESAAASPVRGPW